MNLTPEEALQRYATNENIPTVVARARVQRWIDMCTAQHNPVIDPIPRKGKKPTVEEVMMYITGIINMAEGSDATYDDVLFMKILNIKI